MRRVHVLAAAAVSVLAALAGCGDDDGGADATTTAEAAPSTTATTATPDEPTTTGPPATTSSPTSTTAGEGGDALDLADGRHAVYVTEIDVAGRTLTFDVIQFLTGDEAIAAYQEDTGDAEGPPNDYYIRNVNDRLRTAPVAAEVTVTLVRLLDDSDPGSTPGTFEELPTYFQDYATPEQGRLSYNPFRLTVAGGSIVAIDEQYVP